jgi:hypothetical protein
MVGLIAETILPSSETPGAAEAGVADFIGHMLANWYSAEERERFLSGLDEFAARCVAETGKSFGDLMHDERHRFAEDRDREALALGPRSLATAPFFAAVKELTLIGYYTSSVGSAAIGYLGPIGAGPADEKLGCGAVWN